MASTPTSLPYEEKLYNTETKDNLSAEVNYQAVALAT